MKKYIVNDTIIELIFKNDKNDILLQKRKKLEEKINSLIIKQIKNGISEIKKEATRIIKNNPKYRKKKVMIQDRKKGTYTKTVYVNPNKNKDFNKIKKELIDKVVLDISKKILGDDYVEKTKPNNDDIPKLLEEAKKKGKYGLFDAIDKVIKDGIKKGIFNPGVLKLPEQHPEEIEKIKKRLKKLDENIEKKKEILGSDFSEAKKIQDEMLKKYKDKKSPNKEKTIFKKYKKRDKKGKIKRKQKDENLKKSLEDLIESYGLDKVLSTLEVLTGTSLRSKNKSNEDIINEFELRERNDLPDEYENIEIIRENDDFKVSVSRSKNGKKHRINDFENKSGKEDYMLKEFTAGQLKLLEEMHKGKNYDGVEIRNQGYDDVPIPTADAAAENGFSPNIDELIKEQKEKGLNKFIEKNKKIREAIKVGDIEKAIKEINPGRNIAKDIIKGYEIAKKTKGEKDFNIKIDEKDLQNIKNSLKESLESKIFSKQLNNFFDKNYAKNELSEDEIKKIFEKGIKDSFYVELPEEKDPVKKTIKDRLKNKFTVNLPKDKIIKSKQNGDIVLFSNILNSIKETLQNSNNITQNSGDYNTYKRRIE